MGRFDDLWSLFYVLVEFAKGYLPWRKLKDKDQIGEMKLQYYDNYDLVADLPQEFQLFMKHLKCLQYADRPDYEMILSLLEQLYKKIGANEDTPYDWEVYQKSTSNNQVSISPSTASCHSAVTPIFISTNQTPSSQSSNIRKNLQQRLMFSTFVAQFP